MLADIGIERAVLAGLCQFGKDAAVEVEGLVNMYTFTDQGNQMLYKCITEALKQSLSIDITSLVAAAKELSLYDVVAKSKKDLEFINSLFLFPIKNENVRPFAKRLAKLEFARKAQEKHQEAFNALGALKGSESIDEIVSISEKPIFDLVMEANRGTNNQPELLTDNMDEYIEFLLNNEIENIGIPTPWATYNAAIGGGLRCGGVNMIGARPKRGKSTLCKELAIHVSKNLNIPVLVLDTEMNKQDQLIRSLASESKIEINMIETGKFNKSDLLVGIIKNTYTKLKNNKNFFYVSVAGEAFDNIMSIIRRWIVKHVGFGEDGKTKPCLVIYDYFKLMDKSDLKSLKEYEAMGYQISTFTDFTKEYHFPVMAFVQLNRQEDISQSDRLRWLCQSYSSFLDKTPEQLSEDGGVQNGNRVLTIEDSRYGPGLGSSDYINMFINGGYSTVVELGLKSQLKVTNDNGEDENL